MMQISIIGKSLATMMRLLTRITNVSRQKYVYIRAISFNSTRFHDLNKVSNAKIEDSIRNRQIKLLLKDTIKIELNQFYI